MKISRIMVFVTELTFVAIASAAEWDFTKGVPAECTTRRFTSLVPGKGLEPAQISDKNRSPAGVVVGQRFTLPETFLVEAEFTPYCDWTNESDRAAAETSARRGVIRGFRSSSTNATENGRQRCTPVLGMIHVPFPVRHSSRRKGV